jgi:hypothetical protein
MKLAYIAGPYRAATPWDIEQNVRRAEEASLFVASHGLMPVCPHTQSRFFYGQGEEDFWLEGTMAMLQRCDLLVITGLWEDSLGTKDEILKAKELEMPTFYLSGFGDHIEATPAFYRFAKEEQY